MAKAEFGNARTALGAWKQCSGTIGTMPLKQTRLGGCQSLVFLKKLTQTTTCRYYVRQVIANGGRKPGAGGKRPETFAEIYGAWLPTHQASKSTLDCYKGAYKHFAPVHNINIDDIYIYIYIC